MNRLSIAVACLASLPPFAAVAAAEAPPATRPANELSYIQIGNTGYTPEPGTPLDVYGTASLPIAAAPLPAGRLDGVHVEEYLKALQVRLPRFRYIIRRNNVTESYTPLLPNMETSSLTLGEFVNFVNQNCPGVRIEPDNSVSQNDPLYVVALSGSTSPTTKVPAASVVHAVSIRAAIQVQQQIRSEDANAAMADVLSLVQAMVNESPDRSTVKLKVHEATSMLIFDGPAALGDTVASAIETMSRLTDDERSLLLAGLSGPQKDGPPKVIATRPAAR